MRLETKDASDFTGGEVGFRFRQTLEFQTNGTGITSSSILAWQPTEKLEFLLNYTQRELDVQEDGRGQPINPAVRGIDDPSYLFKGKLTFGEDDAHSLTASYTKTESSQFDVPYDSFGLGVGFGNVDRMVASETAMLRYGYNPTDNDLIDLTFQVSYAHEEIEQSPTSPFPPFTVALRDADHRYETSTLTLKNRAMFDTGAVGHDFVAGLEYIHRERLNASSAPGGDDHRWAVFAVDEMSIGDAWTITPALRYETSEIQESTAPNNGRFTDEALMGGLSLRYAFGNGLAIFGSAAYTEVLPPIDDLDDLARITQSEKSRTYEIGASYEKTDAFRSGDKLSLKANLYDTELWDVTSFVVNTAPVGPPGVRTAGPDSHPRDRDRRLLRDADRPLFRPERQHRRRGRNDSGTGQARLAQPGGQHAAADRRQAVPGDLRPELGSGCRRRDHHQRGAQPGPYHAQPTRHDRPQERCLERHRVPRRDREPV